MGAAGGVAGVPERGVLRGHAAPGGPLLLAGDSLTKNMFDSLHNNLQQGSTAGGAKSAAFVPRICKHWEKGGRMPRDKVLCEALDACPFAVFHARNDRLSRLEGAPYRRGNEYFLPWLSLVKTWGIRAVVLNRGAHLAPTPEFKEELEVTLWVLRQKHPDLLLLYRATPPGHADCETIHRPLSAPQNASSLPYGWGSFHEQNAIAQGLVEACGGLYLDVERMTSLRSGRPPRVRLPASTTACTTATRGPWTPGSPTSRTPSPNWSENLGDKAMLGQSRGSKSTGYQLAAQTADMKLYSVLSS